MFISSTTRAVRATWAGVMLLTLLAPFVGWGHTVAVTRGDLVGAQEITLGNVATVDELAHIEAAEVTAARFFPDSRQLAVAVPDGVALYDTTTLELLRTIDTGPSRRIALSPDGTLLATISGRSAQLWQVSDGALLFTLTGHGGDVQDVAFSPDGDTVATAALDRSARLWRVSNGELFYTLTHVGQVYSLDFRFDGQVLATGSDMGITLWQPITGARLRITDVIFAIANAVGFSADGLTLAAAMNNGNVRVRSGNNYGTRGDLPNDQAMTALAFSPNGEIMAFGGIDQQVQLWNRAQNGLAATLRGHLGAINSMAFSPDGRLLVTTALDGTVRLWGTDAPASAATSPSSPDAATEVPATATPVERVQVVIGVPPTSTPIGGAAPTATPPATATSTATTPPTPTVPPTATATPTLSPTASPTPSPVPVQEGVILVSNVGKLVAVREVETGSATDLAVSADGRWVAVATNERVLILDAQTMTTVRELETPATSLAFSPDGTLLVSASGVVASLWRVEDGELLGELADHRSAIMDVTFSPDGATLATASLDQLARLWRVSDGALLRQFSHFGSVHSVGFSPDGTALATGTTVGTVLWRVSDGRRISVLTLNPNRANRMVFSSDGENLAAATENSNIWLWREGGRGDWVVMEGHTNAATDVAFSPDGKLLASASADGTVRLWRMSDAAALRALNCSTGTVTSVSFSADGAALLVAAADGTLQEWALP